MSRILFCDSSKDWGGLQHWMSRVSDGMRPRGWESLLISPRAYLDESDFFTAALVHAIECGPGLDVAVVGTGRDVRVLALRWRRRPRPLIWRVGGQPATNWLQKITRDRFVDHVLVPSEYSRGFMAEAGFDPDNIKVIPNGIAVVPPPTPDEVKEARQSLGWRDDEFIVLFVGSLRRVKRVDILIKAFAALAHKYSQLRLVIVGTGVKESELKEQAAQAGYADRITFVGFQQDTAPFFIGCDLFVLPSREETFGWVLLEAMMRGKPIVASSAGAVPEVVGHNEAAILVESGDVNALAAAIQRVIGDDELRDRLGAAGVKRVSERFTEEMMLDRLDQYFRTFLQ